WYTAFMYDWSSVPAGKHGMSVLRVPEDADDLATQLAVQGGPQQGHRHLDYVDFHSYPAYPLNPDVVASRDAMQRIFPGSIVVLGEFGYNTLGPADEAAQRDAVATITSTARAASVPYYLNWMLWDDTPGAPLHYGWGYNPHLPKDVLGSVAAAAAIFPNAD